MKTASRGSMLLKDVVPLKAFNLMLHDIVKLPIFQIPLDVSSSLLPLLISILLEFCNFWYFTESQKKEKKVGGKERHKMQFGGECKFSPYTSHIACLFGWLGLEWHSFQSKEHVESLVLGMGKGLTKRWIAQFLTSRSSTSAGAMDPTAANLSVSPTEQVLYNSLLPASCTEVWIIYPVCSYLYCMCQVEKVTLAYTS